MAAERKKYSYFIAKCANISSLQTCITNKQWACKDRLTSLEQPREILTAAFEDSGKVIIIFSVNNCHGWHGYLEMVTKPSLKSPENGTGDISNKNCDAFKQSYSCNEFEPEPNKHLPKEECLIDNLESDSKFGDTNGKVQDSVQTLPKEESCLGKQNKENDEVPWYYFKVKWITEFYSQFGEQCLPFQKTVNIFCKDNTPLNKARNWNELDGISGQRVIDMIDEQYKKLESKRQEKIKFQESKLPPPFIQKESVHSVTNFIDNWSLLLKRVECELGTVILACPFGSQR